VAAEGLDLRDHGPRAALGADEQALPGVDRVEQGDAGQPGDVAGDGQDGSDVGDLLADDAADHVAEGLHGAVGTVDDVRVVAGDGVEGGVDDVAAVRAGRDDRGQPQRGEDDVRQHKFRHAPTVDGPGGR